MRYAADGLLPLGTPQLEIANNRTSAWTVRRLVYLAFIQTGSRALHAVRSASHERQHRQCYSLYLTYSASGPTARGAASSSPEPRAGHSSGMSHGTYGYRPRPPSVSFQPSSSRESGRERNGHF